MRIHLLAALAALAASAAHAQSTTFDGVYEADNGGASAPRCTTKINWRLRVHNGTLTARTATIGELEGPVSPDGTLSIVSGQTTFSGKFSGKHFAGILSNRGCQYDMQYTKP